jgi:hypothetical protein
MGDNAGENKSHEIIEFFESLAVKNIFSTTDEHRHCLCSLGRNSPQNGLPESAINSIMTLSRTIMTGSGL